jgi:fluoroquinolone resistance protein
MILSGTADKKRVIKKKKFEDHDFSAVELINTVWRHCTFVNCKFDNTIFKDNTFINCRFIDLSFSGCRFTDCQIAKNSGKHSGIFENVQFENCRFTRSDFNFPVIRSCRFINNVYNETDFDGSRFYDCWFAGDIDSVEFRGYSVLATTHWRGLFKQVEPRKYRNHMKNVDFSQARLRYAGFSHGINLADCRFPDDGNGFLITSPRACFARAKAIIENTWNPNDKKRALHLIDTFLFTKNHESMPLIYFYKRPSVESLRAFDEKLFDLIKNISNDQAV